MPRTRRNPRTIVSVGYEGRSLEELLELLGEHEVKVLVDVRLNATSRKKGFSKSALAAALGATGIEYRHERDLGNPKENREAFRRGLQTARERYRRHLTNGAKERFSATVTLAESRRIALLCFESQHSECHRSAIIDLALAQGANLAVVEI